MMHYAKLASREGLDKTRGVIDEALRGLSTDPTNAQSVYSNLTRMYEAVAGHPQASAVVDSALAAHKNVELLQDLVKMHLREEEIQWVLGRVMALACLASLRFQCQAGTVELWNTLFDMRSAHPQSIRVQQASLQATEALFSSNEFHATKMRPQLLLDDLLGVVDRFQLVQTPQRWAHKVVVLALRVLVALYSSPRAQRILFDGCSRAEAERWTLEIAKRMLKSFSIFNRDVDAISSWLVLVLLLLRQHPAQVLESLFSSVVKPWWFIAVVDRWQPNAQVTFSLLPTLSHIFELPHNTLGDLVQLALAEKLIVEHNLLEVMCNIIDHYHRVTAEDNNTKSSHHNSCMLVLLEAIRVVRQWSERPGLGARFEASKGVKTVLLPVMVEQLHRHQISEQISSSTLVLLLEILLSLRHLAVGKIARSVLVVSDSFQTSLKWLQTCRGSTVADFQSDGDLVALIAREARNIQALVLPAVEKKSTGPTLRMENTPASKPTSVLVQKKLAVKPGTLQIYSRSVRK